MDLKMPKYANKVVKEGLVFWAEKLAEAKSEEQQLSAKIKLKEKQNQVVEAYQLTEDMIVPLNSKGDKVAASAGDYRMVTAEGKVKVVAKEKFESFYELLDE